MRVMRKSTQMMMNWKKWREVVIKKSKKTSNLLVEGVKRKRLRTQYLIKESL